MKVTVYSKENKIEYEITSFGKTTVSKKMRYFSKFKQEFKNIESIMTLGDCEMICLSRKNARGIKEQLTIPTKNQKIFIDKK